MKKLPVPADVLPVLKEHSEKWAGCIAATQASHDGTIKKLGEETIAARSKQERLCIKEIATRLKDAGHADIAAKMLDAKEYFDDTSDLLSDDEWKTVRYCLCSPELKERLAAERKKRCTAICERGENNRKWNKEDWTQQRHRYADKLEANNATSNRRLIERLRSESFVPLLDFEIEKVYENEYDECFGSSSDDD